MDIGNAKQALGLQNKTLGLQLQPRKNAKCRPCNVKHHHLLRPAFGRYFQTYMCIYGLKKVEGPLIIIGPPTQKSGWAMPVRPPFPTPMALTAGAVK